jgi:N-glycosidase YbiA
MIDQFKGDWQFLSNFYPSPVWYEGKCYSTVEHAYQAAKTENEELREIIRKSATPGKAKKLGQEIMCRPDWEEVKVYVMTQLLWSKFGQDTDLRRRLLETGEDPLVEGNYWNDEFWGLDLKTNQGQNVLGKLLMAIRSVMHETEARRRKTEKEAGES